MPERSRIAIFKRSHYEEMRLEPVHSEMLARQTQPTQRTGKDFWDERFKSTRAYDTNLARTAEQVHKNYLPDSK